MSFTSTLFKLARLSADGRAVRKGPAAVGRRAVRKVAYRKVNGSLGKTLFKILGGK